MILDARIFSGLLLRGWSRFVLFVLLTTAHLSSQILTKEPITQANLLPDTDQDKKRDHRTGTIMTWLLNCMQRKKKRK